MPTSLEVFAPFDSGAGSNVLEDTWRKMARYWLATGVIRGALNQFEVYADSTGMQCKVKTGYCWIQGHYGESTTEKTLGIAAAHATLPRDDRVVLRADFINNRIELDILAGTPAASPTPTAVTQSTSVWEIPLAKIRVGAAVVTITAGNVTDERTQFTSNANSPGALIAEARLTASAANIVADAIPQTFRHLWLVQRVKTTSTAVQGLKCRFNDDAANNYEYQFMEASGTAVTAARTNATSATEVGVASPNNITANLAAVSECLIHDYTASSYLKMTTARASFHSAASTLKIWTASGHWSGGSGGPITKIMVYPAAGSFDAGTFVSLYGLG